MSCPKLFKLRRWTVGDGVIATFFTCARPGRKESKVDRVPDGVVRRWALDVSALGPEPVVVSLLGRKPDGMSEFWFYSFHGGLDLAQDHPGKPSFGAWLASVVPNILLVEHPTIDFQSIATETLHAIEHDVRTLLSQRMTVVIVDSGGETRTGQVCRHLGAKEAFPTVPYLPASSG